MEIELILYVMTPLQARSTVVLSTAVSLYGLLALQQVTSNITVTKFIVFIIIYFNRRKHSTKRQDVGVSSHRKV